MANRLAVLALLPCLGLGSCCTMSRLFCGPDKSEWVSESYASPTATVKTLLEAIRRDDPDVIYRCLSEGFRAANRMDNLVAKLAWDQLKAATPGLHLAGYAEVPTPVIGDNGATFVLDVEGRQMRIDVIREAYLELDWVREDGSLGEMSRPLSSFQQAISLAYLDDPELEFDMSRATFRPFTFEHEGEAGVPLRNVTRAGVVRRWKVAALDLPEG